MYKIELSWKEISLNLDMVEQKLRLDPNYVGNQSSSIKLELYFNEEPSEARKQEITDYWDSLDESSQEALFYRSKSAIDAAKQSLKQGIPNKTWNQMVSVERKLQMGLDVSAQDLIDAGVL